MTYLATLLKLAKFSITECMAAVAKMSAAYARKLDVAQRNYRHSTDVG